MTENFNREFIFPTAYYSIHKPQFLDNLNAVSSEYIERQKLIHSIDRDGFNGYQTENFHFDERIKDFVSYIISVSWDILITQGYDLSGEQINLREMWLHEYYKGCSMDQHVHGYKSHIVGFYFLETPENCSKVMFYDPRPGKVQSTLLEANSSDLTYASSTVNIAPQPGFLVITNSWLPHSFSRNLSDEPFKFIHFNLHLSTRKDQKNIDIPTDTGPIII